MPALCGAGRLDEATTLADRGYDAAIAAHDTDLQAAFALQRGLVATHSGWLVSARRHFDEAATLYRELDDVASSRWALGGITLAAGMGSDSNGADAALTELAGLDRPRRCDSTTSTTSSVGAGGRSRPMGSGQRDRLAELAQRIDGALGPAFAAHADAVLSGGGQPLDAAARRLAGARRGSPRRRGRAGRR